MVRPTLRFLAAAACAAALALSVSAQRGRPESRMADAAKAFLATLDASQKQKATFPVASDERLNWHFIPKPGQRKGIPLKEMNADQRKAALELLRAGLSQKGYDKTNAIRELEIILHEVENKSPTRDPQAYFFTVFGEPADGATWGWRYEGHHCSLNWTIVRGQAVASTPQFFGTNPAEVRVSIPNAPPMGTRLLGVEEDLARALVKSLTEGQRAEGVISATAPPDILTAASRKADIQEDKGIAYSKLTPEQREMLLGIIREYAAAQPRPLAQKRLQAIRAAGLDSVKFAWMGGLEKNQPHYYRIQGSTFLVEYDNTQNNANHVHAVWRDFKGDWGMDLLAMHYKAHPHRIAKARP